MCYPPAYDHRDRQVLKRLAPVSLLLAYEEIPPSLLNPTGANAWQVGLHRLCQRFTVPVGRRVQRVDGSGHVDLHPWAVSEEQLARPGAP